jgi:enamine deaminase RidA (YjgF/YER057c/UK114 family)
MFGLTVGRVAREIVLTECQRPGEPLRAAFHRLAVELAAGDATLLSLMIYGALRARPEIEAAMSAELGPVEWPVTWIEGLGGDAQPLAGLQAFAVSGRPVMRIRVGRRVVASVFEDGNARHCLLGGLGPTAGGLTPGAQVQQTFENLEWALGRAGFGLGDVVRTWFYNEAILAWYDDFNRVRSAHYANVAWRTGSLPASTGIGARNADGAALVVAAWAMQPLAATAYAREIGSPLQCPAPKYGSSFSRAMEVASGGVRRLFISGTASIHPDGSTAWVGDIGKQVGLTMEVIAAILQSRGMGYRDVTRATAYFKAPEFMPAFDAWCAARELTDMPVVALHADVCRDALLFEIEVDAVVAG